MTDVVWSEEIFCPFFTEMWSLLSESTKPDYTSGKKIHFFLKAIDLTKQIRLRKTKIEFKNE